MNLRKYSKKIIVVVSLITMSNVDCMARLTQSFARFAQRANAPLQKANLSPKHALSLGSAIALSACAAISTEDSNPKTTVPANVVPNSVYAEIRGTRDGWVRIYKGKEYANHSNHFKNWFSRFWSPKLYFFNDKDEELSREEFQQNYNLQGSKFVIIPPSRIESRKKTDQIRSEIQSRLAEFPTAQKAILDTRDLKGRTFVYVLDDKGNVIASTQADHRLRNAKPTDKLDLLTIYNLKKQIKNPEFLENLTFEHIIKR